MIEDNLTGQIVPVGNPHALADAIRAFSGRAHDSAVGDALAAMTDRYSPKRCAEAIIVATKALALSEKWSSNE
jgi:hypothetical protein